MYACTCTVMLAIAQMEVMLVKVPVVTLTMYANGVSLLM